jgi:hypothetical protein
LEQLIGRLNHVSAIIPMSRFFLGGLRSRHRPSAPAHIIIHLAGRIEQLALRLWLDFLARAHTGINLNLLTLRQPTNIMFSDACPSGIGGFSVKSSRAWRYHLRHPNVLHINTLEFLASVVGPLGTPPSAHSPAGQHPSPHGQFELRRVASQEQLRPKKVPGTR